MPSGRIDVLVRGQVDAYALPTQLSSLATFLAPTIAFGGQPGPNSPGAPSIPDGVWPMGFQGYSKGIPVTLQDVHSDWDFATMGYDLSGKRIHGIVNWPAASGTGTLVGGDGFEIIGSDTGSSASAYLNCNTHFTQTFPTFSNFTILPTVPTVSTNGFMGNEATLFNVDISGVGGDPFSPNDLSNGKRPLNINLDWFYFHDYVYYLNDGGSHPDGTHNDDTQCPGGTNATPWTRGYSTGCAHPTKGDGAYLRTHGRNAGTYANVPCPDGQGNSGVQITQNVDHVNIAYDRCRFGGGLYATINLASNGSTTQLNFAVTNSLFDGNSISGNDIGGDNSTSPGTKLVQSGNLRTNGHAITVTRVVA